jgi:hypothetical protein
MRNRKRLLARFLAWSATLETDVCASSDVDTVYKELIANTIPNSRMVSAGVLAVNRAQEYGYTLLTAL